jgi:hydroxymethylbilane synthase
MKLRLGARGSALSLAQARLVAAALVGDGSAEVDIVEVRTTGDRLSAAGEPIGWKGDFTRELDDALLSGAIDLAVHSLKDVPSALPAGIRLAAVPEREDPRDVFVGRVAASLAALPRAARVGTSSPRRGAQLLAARPDLSIVEARGNVDTRLRRLQEGKWDGIVLARAGLARLNRLDAVSEVFPIETLLPAVGQGALAVVTRSDDARVRSAVSAVDDPRSHAEVRAERSLLARLEAGCRAPVAALARVQGGRLTLDAGVFAADGSRTLRETGEGSASEPEAVGLALGERLLARGAAALLAVTTR